MIDLILERYPDEEILKADGYDSAIIGIDEVSMRLIYSKALIIAILQSPEHGMDYLEAIEFFDYNIGSAYVGEKTPIYMENVFE
tara:strand:+ start:298 stop:549 length:252 start_codon:yes stop_codon:yes gene_type:complete